MPKNISSPDRVIRVIVGVILAILPFVTQLTPLWTWVSVIVGLVLIATALIGTCPMYQLLGIGRKCRR